jgi:threonine aldolase
MPAAAGSTGAARLLCIENSHNNAGGIAVSGERMAAVSEAARRLGLSIHLDGARLFNVAAALNVRPRQLTDPVDSVAVSLNKGLCAPVGALLCGSRTIIEAARVHAGRLGAGSIHKAGILAAAGLVALRQMPARLVDDNRRAAALADGLRRLSGVEIRMESVQTNIVVAAVTRSRDFVERLKERKIRVYERPDGRLRFVTHRLIDDEAVMRVLQVAQEELQ